MCHLHENELGAMKQISPVGKGFRRGKGKSWVVGLSPAVRWCSLGAEQSCTCL